MASSIVTTCSTTKNHLPVALTFAWVTAVLLLTSSCATSDSPSAQKDVSSTALDIHDSSPSITAVDSAYFHSYTLVDKEFGTMVTVTVDGSIRTITTNALPNHETGVFPNSGNPNRLSAQNTTYRYPAEPIYLGSATRARTIGVAVNGIKFEPGTAETVSCASGEMFRIEGLQTTYDLGMDFNNAHVQPTGEYHYHGVSHQLVDTFASSNDLVHVGFAADGFLMHHSTIARYQPSYVLSKTPRTGTNCTTRGPMGNSHVDIKGTMPDGTYTSDWIYQEGSGDLDRCNGITINDTYLYLITDTYPYVGRCLNGAITSDAGMAARNGPPPRGHDHPPPLRRP